MRTTVSGSEAVAKFQAYFDPRNGGKRGLANRRVSRCSMCLPHQTHIACHATDFASNHAFVQCLLCLRIVEWGASRRRLRADPPLSWCAIRVGTISYVQLQALSQIAGTRCGIAWTAVSVEKQGQYAQCNSVSVRGCELATEELSATFPSAALVRYGPGVASTVFALRFVKLSSRTWP